MMLGYDDDYDDIDDDDSRPMGQEEGRLMAFLTYDNTSAKSVDQRELH